MDKPTYNTLGTILILPGEMTMRFFGKFVANFILNKLALAKIILERYFVVIRHPDGQAVYRVASL